MYKGTIKILNREIIAIGSQDRIRKVSSYICAPLHVTQDTKSEGGFSMMIFFGQAWNWNEFPAELKTQYDKELSDFAASLPDEISNRLPLEKLPSNQFYRKYIPTETQLKEMREARKTPEEHAKEERDRIAQEARNEESRKAHEAKKAQDAADAERYKVEYAYLLPVSNQESSRITATKNIRLMLSRNFPGTRFSVTSETFANGDAIRIEYTDGPAYEKVDKICRMFQPYGSDESGDFWDYHGTPFASMFGDAKFVTTTRNISPETDKAWKEEISARYNWSETANPFDCQAQERRDFHDKHRELDIEPAANQAATEPEQAAGAEGVTIRKNEEHNGIEIKFSAKPAPDVIEWLKCHGFHWSMRCKLWYAKYQETKEQQAREHFQLA